MNLNRSTKTDLTTLPPLAANVPQIGGRFNAANVLLCLGF